VSKHPWIVYNPLMTWYNTGLSDHRLLCCGRVHCTSRHLAGHGDHSTSTHSKLTYYRLSSMMNNSGLHWAATVLWNCVTTPSLHCSTDRFHPGQSPVIVDIWTCGVISSVTMLNVSYVVWSVQHVRLGLCMIPCYQLWCGIPRVLRRLVSSNCFEHSQTSNVRLIRYRQRCWRLTWMFWHPSLTGCSTGH